MIWLPLAFGCASDPRPAPVDPDPEAEVDTSAPEPPAPDTSDSAASPPETEPTWPLVYPYVPYDCSLGVPPVATATETLSVRGEEDLGFDAAGRLVTSWGRLLRHVPGEPGEPWSGPNGNNRGIDLWVDGGVLVTDAGIDRIVRYDPATGAGEPFGPEVAHLAQLEIGRDGTVYLPTLEGDLLALDPEQAAYTLIGSIPSAYAIAMAPDERRIYLPTFGLDAAVWVVDRGDDGAWSAPAPWIEVPTDGHLQGAATDACGNLYLVEANGCVVWRATPEGEATVIADLDWGYCSNLAFGREGAGWDPLSVYIATYNRVIRVEVGVPGRPR